MTTTTVHIATNTAAKLVNGENASADACALKNGGNAPSGETNGENKDGATGIEPIAITTGATILTPTSAFVSGVNVLAAVQCESVRPRAWLIDGGDNLHTATFVNVTRG